MNRAIRQGQVYWVDDVPPLDGERMKRRPVVVLSPPQITSGPDEKLIVVAITTKPGRRSAIAIPSKATHERSTSGLTKPAWAVPAWFLSVDRSRLVDLAGFVSGTTLSSIMEATLAAMDAAQGGGSP
ncbi:MAG: type II toxin-antitoxin system PemK/MazF family toxin [Phycisphaerales bacterium]|nr:type II toxin-antitoxin system PemK/MazF family toxin [Phycisphaerales bacterium]